MHPLAAALPLLLPLPLPSAPPLPLPGCQVFADQPEAPNAFYTVGHGGVSCDTPVTDLEVTVCLEGLDPTGWVPFSCDGASDPGPASYLDAITTGCRWGVDVIRTTAAGRTAGGWQARAESVPTVFYCTPL